MKLVNKYIYRTLGYYLALALLFLLGLQLVIEFSGEFSQIGVGQYTFGKMLLHTLLLLPFDVYQFFPIAGLIGFMIGLSSLAARQELIILQVAGWSIARITRTILKLGAFFVSLMLILGEIISPLAQYRAEQVKMRAISDGRALLTNHGVWINDGEQIINVRSAYDERLHDIFIYSFNKQLTLQEISWAAKAHFDGKNWLMQDLVGTKINRTYTERFACNHKNIRLALLPNLTGIKALNSDQKNLLDLYKYIKTRQHYGLSVVEYQLTFWQRIFNPLAALVMIFLAVPFVFGSLRSSTLGFKLMLGILTGFTFYIINQFMGPFCLVYQLTPWCAALLPLLLFLLLGSVMLVKR